MGLKIFLNGEMVEKDKAVISIFDHGLLYGDGVFEGIRSYNRRVFRFDQHLDRLYESAEAIRIDMLMTKETFKEKTLETLRINDLDDAYIRAVITRGIGDLGLDPRKCIEHTVFIITDKIQLYPEELYETGLNIIIAKTRRNHPLSISPKIKSLNYLNNILGKIDAIDAGTQEAIMLSPDDGCIVECTGDNIFFRKGEKVFTPHPELGALTGITQGAVIDIARERGIKVEYKKMFPEELKGVEECFLTGTAAEIIPVVKIEDMIIGDGKPGQMTKDLLQDFRKLTETDGTAY
jgi:branched-chain amino acid aminotransferase